MNIFRIFFRHKHECNGSVELRILNKLREMENKLMATKAEVLQAIADEKDQVVSKLNDLNVTIQALRDQIAAGNPVTEADLDEIVNAVHDIFVP